MNNYKKVTYTLPTGIINTIEKRSFLAEMTMSRWLSNCIQNGYEMMIDGYYDNGKRPLVGIKRKRNGTVPKTFSVPIKVSNTLSWFSKTLDVKTSHLVALCILNFEYQILRGQSLRMVDLIKIVDTSPN
jgi:hypothetical protein